MIHADLTADHLLGRLENGQWTPLGLIDFGDAMIGNLYYELLALYLDMFRCEKPLLRAFLETYGLDESARRQFPQKAMTTLLLHRFNVPYGIAAHYPAALKAPTLDDLAILLWDLTSES